MMKRINVLCISGYMSTLRVQQRANSSERKKLSKSYIMSLKSLRMSVTDLRAQFCRHVSLQLTLDLCGCCCWWRTAREIPTPFSSTSTFRKASATRSQAAWALMMCWPGPTPLCSETFLESIQVNMPLQNNRCSHFPETLQKVLQGPLSSPVQVYICYSTTKEEKSHTHLSSVLLFIYTRRHILLLQWGFAQRSKTVCLLVSSCFWMLFVLFCVCFLAIAIGCQPEQTFSQSVKLNYSQTGNFCGLLFVSLTLKLF